MDDTITMDDEILVDGEILMNEVVSSTSDKTEEDIAKVFTTEDVRDGVSNSNAVDIEDTDGTTLVGILESTLINVELDISGEIIEDTSVKTDESTIEEIDVENGKDKLIVLEDASIKLDINGRIDVEAADDAGTSTSVLEVISMLIWLLNGNDENIKLLEEDGKTNLLIERKGDTSIVLDDAIIMMLEDGACETIMMRLDVDNEAILLVDEPWGTIIILDGASDANILLDVADEAILLIDGDTESFILLEGACETVLLVDGFCGTIILLDRAGDVIMLLERVGGAILVVDRDAESLILLDEADETIVMMLDMASVAILLLDGADEATILLNRAGDAIILIDGGGKTNILLESDDEGNSKVLDVPIIMLLDRTWEIIILLDRDVEKIILLTGTLEKFSSTIRVLLWMSETNLDDDVRMLDWLLERISGRIILLIKLLNLVIELNGIIIINDELDGASRDEDGLFVITSGLFVVVSGLFVVGSGGLFVIGNVTVPVAHSEFRKSCVKWHPSVQ